MPIYTRTGDEGKTGLATGQRVSKDSKVIEFVGSLDELNALVGVCIAEIDAIEDADDDEFTNEAEVLEDIQRDLFVVGAIAVGANLSFTAGREVSNIEATIDDYEKLLPKLKNFILPGGSKAAASIHHARTIVRKIERQAVALKSPSVEPFLPYLNRLSDLLFVMARYINHKTGIPELIWKS